MTNDEALDAIDNLQTWGWEKPPALSDEDFSCVIDELFCYLTDRSQIEPYCKTQFLQETIDKSNRRLRAFLPDFRRRFEAGSRNQAEIFIEEAINWSSNKFERMIVNIYIESTQKVRQKHDIKDDMGIDEIIMQLVGCHWQKVAMIAGTVMALRSGLVDTNIAERVKVLVSSGLLESQGSLSNMRYSEVRLPVGKEGAVTDTLS